MQRIVLICTALLALAGCGGGGSDGAAASNGGSSPPTTPAPPPSPPVQVTFLSSAVNVTAVNGDPAPADHTVKIKLANQTAPFWYRWRRDGDPLIESAGLGSPDSAGVYTFEIRLVRPALLGAGQYSTSLTLSLCADQECTQPYAGSPQRIPITYVVTGAALPQTYVSWTWTAPFPSIELETRETQAPLYELTGYLNDLPLLRKVYLRRTTSKTGLIKSMTASFDEASPIVRYAVTLKSPASLGSGFFDDEVTVDLCFVPDCNERAGTNAFTFRPKMTVLATRGGELTYRSRYIDADTGALAWSDVTQRLYLASTPQTPSFTSPNTVLALDPVTLATTASVALGVSGLDDIAIASDGLGLFVARRRHSIVHHLQLPSLANDYDIAFAPPAAEETYPIVAASLLPLAGQPQSILMSLHTYGAGKGIVAYDGTTARSTRIAQTAPTEGVTRLAPGATADSFIAFRQSRTVPPSQSLDALQVTPSGVATTSSTPAPAAFTFPHDAGTRVQYANGRLYDEAGNVRDATNGAILSALALPEGLQLDSFTVDAAHNRLFAAVERQNGSTYPYLLSYRLDTLKLLAVARLGGDNDSVYPSGSILRTWGSDGLAMTDGHTVIAMSGTFFTTYEGTPVSSAQ